MKSSLRKLTPAPLLREYHRARGILAALLAGFPGKKLTSIGVTGTDGKTTTTNFIASILREAHLKVSWISTISARIGSLDIETGAHTTTPSPFTLQSFLKRMVRDGDTHAVLEVTSHGLDQFRTWGIPFHIGVLTNVTPEHLDYHGTYEAYVRAKARLLQNAEANGGVAIVNRDDQSYPPIMKYLRGSVITYGEHPEATVRGTDIVVESDKSKAKVITPAGSGEITVPLPGRFNVWNALAAVAASYVLGIPIDIAAKGISNLHYLAGRMEEIPSKRGFRVVVDFAHTPHALELLLTFWKPVVKGRVLLVFGCAGERDAFKRPLMGEIAGRYADLVFLTREDNRSESLEIINRAVREGLEKARKHLHEGYEIIDDRRLAMRTALREAKPGDLVLVTGKGPESGLNIDGTEIPWDDRQVVKEELEAITNQK